MAAACLSMFFEAYLVIKEEARPPIVKASWDSAAQGYFRIIPKTKESLRGEYTAPLTKGVLRSPDGRRRYFVNIRPAAFR